MIHDDDDAIYLKRTETTLIKRSKKFFEKALLIHGEKYDYSQSNYVDMRSNITIRCPIHGFFDTLAKNHMDGSGCNQCGRANCGWLVHGTKEQRMLKFIEKSNERHNFRYDYSKVIYVNGNTHVIIGCPSHGDFNQKPDGHMNTGRGCPKCKRSKGEALVAYWLNKNNFSYETQVGFDGCVFKKQLYVDFYLPQFNLVIEFNGIQHYEYSLVFHKKHSFDNQIIRDQIKYKYLTDNGIDLLVIKYDEIASIGDVLTEKFTKVVQSSPS